MSFFAELKRRNVFRVGIAYLVVAWLIMQVADVVINNIGAPGWVFQVILLILGIGFPVALIFAWAFELTPDGIKKEKDVDRSQSVRKETGRKLNYATIGILALAAGYFFWESRFDQEKEEKAIQTAQHALSMDPLNVDAIDALASAKRDTWHWAEAEELFDKALAIDPESSELLEDYSEFLCSVGKAHKCLEVAEKAHKLDPGFVPLTRNYSAALLMTGKSQEAVDVLQPLAPSWGGQFPSDDGQISELGIDTDNALITGDVSAALEIMKNYEPSDNFIPIKAAALKVLAGKAESKDLNTLKTISAINYSSVGWYSTSIEGYLLAYAGESDHVIDATLEITRIAKWGQSFFAWVPLWNSVRTNPRFHEVLELYRLPEYWDETGWPEFCRRVDAERIECE